MAKEFKLTQKMRAAARKFVLEGENKSQSLRSAGYSEYYIKANVGRIFKNPLMQEYIAELEDQILERELDLWKQIVSDAPKIYNKLRALADEEECPTDVKRKIWQDLLDRAGFQSSNKLDITKSEKVDNSQIDAEIAMIIKDLKDSGIDVERLLGSQKE
jgi:hypothetical protein